MKKLITEAKWKKHLAARQRRQSRSTKRFRAYRKALSHETAGMRRKRSDRHVTHLTAPEILSFLQNPGDTIQFLNRLKAVAAARNVFVDLSAFRSVTPDAIAGLIAAIHDRKVNSRISGNLPNDQSARDTIEQSGFRDHVEGENWVPPLGQMGRVRKRPLTREIVETKYNQVVTTELIAFATEKLTGQVSHHGPTYSVLGEAMLNTLNHASRTSEPQPWWASVYFDKGRKRACFTFIDQGVGIFRSHRLTAFLKLQKGFRLLTNAAIPEKILQGEVRSTTRTPGRGNGLPGMYAHCKALRIRSLTLVANDAVGYVETGAYQPLSSSFEGTLIYWEVEA
jgi:hypothetical protein